MQLMCLIFIQNYIMIISPLPNAQHNQSGNLIYLGTFVCRMQMGCLRRVRLLRKCRRLHLRALRAKPAHQYQTATSRMMSQVREVSACSCNVCRWLRLVSVPPCMVTVSLSLVSQLCVQGITSTLRTRCTLTLPLMASTVGWMASGTCMMM